jgi:hypothetical protein
MRLIISNPLAMRGDGLAEDVLGEVSVSDITTLLKITQDAGSAAGKSHSVCQPF